jgi:hypothetical protein
VSVRNKHSSLFLKKNNQSCSLNLALPTNTSLVGKYKILTSTLLIYKKPNICGQCWSLPSSGAPTNISLGCNCQFVTNTLAYFLEKLISLSSRHKDEENILFHSLSENVKHGAAPGGGIKKVNKEVGENSKHYKTFFFDYHLSIYYTGVCHDRS